MYRILIADADPVRASRLEADLADFDMKAISVFSGEMAVAFCRDYELDLILLDLGLSDAGDAMRLLAGDELTAGIPVVGLGAVGDGPGGGLRGVLERGVGSRELARGLRRCLEGEACQDRGEGAEEEIEGVELAGVGGGLHRNPLPLLLKLSERIMELTRRLAGSATEFGADGPEMFRFVEESSDQMHQRLVRIASAQSHQQESQLSDREVRHEFRNILASVKGFTDLILMEEGIPEDLVEGLKEICGCSKRFVECLDVEKAAAFGQ